jgi:uncharacterized damage-inducible protein DinB
VSRFLHRSSIAAALTLVLGSSSFVHAQVAQQGADAIDARAAARIKTHYLADIDSLHAKVLALANAIPAEKYAWRPNAGVRSIAEVFMHIASEFYFWGPKSIGGNPPADYGNPQQRNAALEKTTDKAAVLAELGKSWQHYKSQVTSADASKLTAKYAPWNVTIEEAAFAMTDDLHEHLGQLIAYARMNGVKPPWTK